MEKYNLSFEELHISLPEVYEAMGYGHAEPDEAVKNEVNKLISRVASVTRPLFLSSSRKEKFWLKRMNWRYLVRFFK